MRQPRRPRCGAGFDGVAVTYIVVVRGQNHVLMVIESSDGVAMEFKTFTDAGEFMQRHILGSLPYEILGVNA